MRLRNVFYAVLLTGALLFTCEINATPIPQSNYTIQFVSSQGNTYTATKAFDGNPSTYWGIYNPAGYSLPGIIEIDLGAVYDVNGFSYTPVNSAPDIKAKNYEIYLSMDGVNWGTPEAMGDFVWDSLTHVEQKDVFFGAISAQYVKLIYNASVLTSTDNINTAELVFHESTTPPTGQMNQGLSFTPVNKQSTLAAPFTLSATSGSGLSAITYSIVSGPATVSGNTLTLTGTAGTVTVKAEEPGNATYYPTETYLQFEVIDFSIYYPKLSTRLTEDFSLEMPSLHAYPIYMNASIDEAAVLSVDEVQVEVDGVPLKVDNNGANYYAWWTPASYGLHTITIIAKGSNGNDSVITRNIQVSNTAVSQTVTTLNDVVIQYGGTNSRWYYGTYTMPQHIGSYDHITANLTVECPSSSGNCDDWDRRAEIEVMGPDGNWIQLIRYITPYGVACNHSIDVTDYASLLQGEIEFRMFIDTWGTGGWQITLDFDHQAGSPTYLYSTIDELWDGSWDLGNPTDLQPVDTVSYTYKTSIESSHLRLSTTGHGWGDNNSKNAAEFYHATNYIDVNGNQFFTQDLWNNCNPNPDGCLNQLGTWTHNRAGWCPGAIAPPNIIDMTSKISSQPIQLTYRFDPTYIDLCHPNHPNCVSGSTCPDCNDGYKAVYHVDGQLINYSNSPLLLGNDRMDKIEENRNLNLSTYPNPTKGRFRLTSSNLKGSSRVYVHKISGEVVKTYYFGTADQLNSYNFDFSSLSTGVYFISIDSKTGQGFSKLVVE